MSRICRYVLNIPLRQLGEVEESRVQEWVERHVPGAELQHRTPGNMSFSIAQQVSLRRSIVTLMLHVTCS